MDKPILPVFRAKVKSLVLDHEFEFMVVAHAEPRYVMPIMIALKDHGLEILDDHEYGWVSNRGEFMTQEEAAELAFANGMMDSKKLRLTIQDDIVPLKKTRITR